MTTGRGVAVGVEIGGSKTTVALIDSHGRVQQRRLAKTLRGRPAPATLDPYMRAIDSILADARVQGLPVCGIGVSIPGSVDYTSRRPLLVPTLPSLNKFPLGSLLETRYGLPSRLHVDVNAALAGEHRFGAGRHFSRLLFLTVNAVVGAAFIVDGELERREQPCIGHVCHLTVAASGPRCSCGKRGCINTLISVDAVQRMVQRALRRGDESSLTRRLLNGEYFSLQLLAEEARRGDSVALQIYDDVGRWLGAAVAKYVELFNPNILILGGGVLCASDLLIQRVQSVLNNHFSSSSSSSSRVCSMVEVVPAALGSDAVLIGSVVPFF
jgi:glucokinase